MYIITKAKNQYFKVYKFVLSTILPLYYRVFPSKYVLHDLGMENKIIVSLTSFSPRLDKLYVTINTILNQSQKPDRVILYLGDDVEKDKLPSSLLKFQELNNLEIQYVDNLRSHKKYFYALQQFPEDLIITVDDDLIYHKNMIKKLFESYIRFPDCVNTMRTHRILYDEKGSALPYAQWEDTCKIFDKPSADLFFTSGAGTIFKAAHLSRDVLDKKGFIENCFTADDVWLNFAARKVGTLVVNTAVTPIEMQLVALKGSQEKSLKIDNRYGSGNDKCIQNVSKYWNMNL